jgi:Helix-turn-helix domain
MGAKEFGALLETVRSEHGWTLAELSDELGRIPPEAGGIGKPLSETGVSRVLDGRRRLTPGFVQHTIDRGIVPAEKAWRAAYPEVTEAVRKLDAYRTLPAPRRRRRSDREVETPAADGEVAEVSSDLDGPTIGTWSESAGWGNARPLERVA